VIFLHVVLLLQRLLNLQCVFLKIVHRLPGDHQLMQMQFHLKNKDLLSGLAVGDRVEFTIENGVGGMVIVAVRK